MILHGDPLEQRILADMNERVALGYNFSPSACIVTSDKVSYLFPRKDSSAHDLYEIGSVTKFFTAHLCSLLQGEGKIDLYQPIDNLVQQIFPQTHLSLRKKTLYDLLTHTSGLIDPASEDYFNESTGNTIAIVDLSLSAIDEYLSEQHLADFVESPIYSNLGYILVGLILEEATGKQYGSLLKQYILDPLRMHETFVGMPESTSLKKVLGHSQGRVVPYWKTERYGAFASIVSTPHDLGIYFQHLIFSSTLSESLSKTPFKLKNMQVYSGLGWSLDERYGGHMYALTGRTLGFSSFVGWDPKSRSAIIFLSDSDTFGNMPYRWLCDAFPQDHLQQEVSLDDELIQKIEGTYVDPSTLEELFTIRATKQYLLLSKEGQLPLVLYRSAKGTFFSKWACDDSLLSIRDEGGKLIICEIRGAKERIIARKV